VARTHWLYGGKKRGARRTGARWVGRLGEAAFFGTLFLLGILSLTAILTWQFVAEESTQIEVGKGYWSMILVAVTFSVIGGGGLIRSILTINASPERRSALAKHAADLELLVEAMPQRSECPSVPNHPDMTNSPGVLLPYRLPPSDTPVWKLLAGALLCVAWLAAAVSTLVVAVNHLQPGRSGWLLLGFGTPFLGVGAWAFQFFVRQLWSLASIGPTSVEVSDVPFSPGREYEAAYSQAGALRFRSIELWLVCEEETTFRQGTDVRSETHATYRQLLHRQRNVKIEPGHPFMQTCRVVIPEDAIHSFCSDHNAVNWKLLVRTDPVSRQTLERSFPIVVFPPPVSEPVAKVEEETVWSR
jgi:hypothetical protein